MTPPPSSPGYRVFISYSHDDEELVGKLERILHENNLVPMRDKNFAYGVGFHAQIREFIEYAHVFMPVITEKSSARGWVHQEIGFAMAQNIPVLPVVIDWKPGEMLQTLHSVMLREQHIIEEPERVQAILSMALFKALVERFRDERFAVYACGFLQEDRTKMMTDYANEVSRIQALLAASPIVAEPGSKKGKAASERPLPLSSMVRQKGALSSFHIPADPVGAQSWKDRYGTAEKTEHRCRLQRGERLALTEHARIHGARIIIDPNVPLSDNNAKVRLARLKCLVDFLKSPDGKKTEVAIYGRMAESENITMVGDWFIATAVARARGKGYYQTIFTRHAPSMQAKIDEFDDEFARLLQGVATPENSREHAIKEIAKTMDELKKKIRE